MGLNMHEKKALAREASKRYQKAGRKDKARILDELAKTTDYNRKYALHLLANWGKSATAAGFELLKNCGFIATHWQELAALDEVDHSKEYHPEGNVWKHTMEALRYRKAASGSFDRRLSLGLLLHDSGKPHSASAGSRSPQTAERRRQEAGLFRRVRRRLAQGMGVPLVPARKILAPLHAAADAVS